VVATAPGGFVAGYLPPVVVIEEGEDITYANADIAPLDFVADGHFLPKRAARKTKWCSGFDAGKCPLFWSQKIGAGESTEVEGLKRVRSGREYNFLCTVHPNMKGTLVVR
jgi:plastocyanin